MKKVQLSLALVIAVLFISCGSGESVEVSEDKKAEVSKETKEEAYNVGMEISGLDNDLVKISNLFYHDSPLKYYGKSDSIIPLIKKLSSTNQTLAMAYLDSIIQDGADVKLMNEEHSEKRDEWDADNGKFNEMYQKIDDDEISDKEVLTFLKEFKNVLKPYYDYVKLINDNWIPIFRHQEKFEEIMNATK